MGDVAVPLVRSWRDGTDLEQNRVLGGEAEQESNTCWQVRGRLNGKVSAVLGESAPDQGRGVVLYFDTAFSISRLGIYVIFFPFHVWLAFFA